MQAVPELAGEDPQPSGERDTAVGQQESMRPTRAVPVQIAFLSVSRGVHCKLHKPCHIAVQVLCHHPLPTTPQASLGHHIHYDQTPVHCIMTIKFIIE